MTKRIILILITLISLNNWAKSQGLFSISRIKNIQNLLVLDDLSLKPYTDKTQTIKKVIENKPLERKQIEDSANYWLRKEEELLSKIKYARKQSSKYMRMLEVSKVEVKESPSDENYFQKVEWNITTLKYWKSTAVNGTLYGFIFMKKINLYTEYAIVVRKPYENINLRIWIYSLEEKKAITEKKDFKTIYLTDRNLPTYLGSRSNKKMMQAKIIFKAPKEGLYKIIIEANGKKSTKNFKAIKLNNYEKNYEKNF